MAMEAIDNGHSYSKVCDEYKIPRSSLKDHMNGKTRFKKMGPKSVLTAEEEIALYHYIEEMAKCGLFIAPTQVKIKVAQMTEERVISFKNGIPGPTWMKWFLNRHPELTLRTSQGLDQNRARALNPHNTNKFYENLESLYTKNAYQSMEIWNLNESRAQANKNGLGQVMARKGARKSQIIVPNEREWMTLITTINVDG